MIQFPSRSTFTALASLYDHGIEMVSGTQLSRYYSHCFKELLHSRVLGPTGPAREIEIEDHNGRRYLAPVTRKQDGHYYLCRYRGWTRLNTEVCKRYRLLKEPMPAIIESAVGLRGKCQRVNDGLVFWGVFSPSDQRNSQQVEVYWSRYLCPQQSEIVRHHMRGRSVRKSAVVLQMSHRPVRHNLGSSVTSLSYDALWSPEGTFDQWQFHQAIAEQADQKLTFGEEFLWFPESGTFVFPDHRTVTFKGASGKMLVDYLVECYRQGKPWVDQEHVTQDILKVKSRRVQDVVKSVADWKTVILDSAVFNA